MADDRPVFQNSKHQYDFEIDCSTWCPEIPAETAADVVFTPSRLYSQNPQGGTEDQWAFADKSWPSTGEPAELFLTLRVLDVETLSQLKVALDSLKARGLRVDGVQISASP